VGEGRKVAAILVADIVGYSRLTGADEEATIARLRALRAELFNPAVASHDGRIVKRTGDGAIIEFRSVVEAVRCALDVTKGLADRNADLTADQRIEVRTGIHLGDVIEEADGDLLGDGVNIAARLEGICAPGAIYLSEDAWRQVRDKLPSAFVDLGERQLKNIARPMRVYTLGGTAGFREAAPLTQPSSGAPPTPPSVVPAPRRIRPLIAVIVAILENIARLIGTYVEKETAQGILPAGSRPDPAVSAEPSRRIERLRRRRIRRNLIFAAILTIAATRACEEVRRAPSPPPASRASVLEETFGPLLANATH
jgi:class 3 adenylate cyclase